MLRRRFFHKGWAILFWACASVSFAQSYIESGYVGVYVENTTYAMVMGTSSTYIIPNENLMFGYSGANSNAWSSHLVFNVDGTAVDFSTSQMTNAGSTASGTGLGASIVSSRTTANNLVLGAQYKIVTNVSSGLYPDMVQMKFSVKNQDTVAHQVGCRCEIDTEVVSNDGANVSTNNGLSVFTTNQIWRSSNGNVPSDWWDYDVSPPGTPLLVGRGSTHGNPLGEAATPPDAMEIAYWEDTNGTAQWTIAPTGSSIGSDSSVVLWWTGTGSETGLNQSLAPGQTREWVTYYGLNEGVLLTTPTFTPVGTPTWTPTTAPTGTPTFTFTKTYTSTATITSTSTPTATRTVTATPTLTPTSTPTFTATVTYTPTPTPTVTDTPTPTHTPLGPLRLWPNPFNPSTAVRGTLKCADMPEGSTLTIYSISGETVFNASEMGFRAEWDGRTKGGKFAASGIYYYVIRRGNAVLLKGILILSGS